MAAHTAKKVTDENQDILYADQDIQVLMLSFDLGLYSVIEEESGPAQLPASQRMTWSWTG